MNKEELKKALKKDLKKLEIKNELYVNLFMGKKQMDGNYAFISIGINNGKGWNDKRSEYKDAIVKILSNHGCKLQGQDTTNEFNWIITY